MIDAMECALVNKNVVRDVREETRRKLLNGNEDMKIRAEGMRYVLEKLDLWEERKDAGAY